MAYLFVLDRCTSTVRRIIHRRGGDTVIEDKFLVLGFASCSYLPSQPERCCPLLVFVVDEAVVGAEELGQHGDVESAA